MQRLDTADGSTRTLLGGSSGPGMSDPDPEPGVPELLQPTRATVSATDTTPTTEIRFMAPSVPAATAASHLAASRASPQSPRSLRSRDRVAPPSRTAR